MTSSRTTRSGRRERQRSSCTRGTPSFTIPCRKFWFELLRLFGLHAFAPQHNDFLQEWWRIQSSKLDGLFQKGFNSLVVLGAWVLWKHRNRCVFQEGYSNLNIALSNARDEVLVWSLAGAKGLSFLQGFDPGIQDS
uniref:Uncharacterized protein n=1 Tax=Zea mays TaxID=4577 RepID=B6SMQ2_MAIZE|nr:hypothetical protein [Zea mays]